MSLSLFSPKVLLASLVVVLLFAACQVTPEKPIETEDYVDLDRFMGDWYVIAHIPARIEANAYNAKERYELVDGSRVKTVFTFRDGGFEGEEQRLEPVGFIEDKETNSVWSMRFFWPFKSDYRIVYVNDDYTQTVVGREARDYVWIMARTPEIEEAQYQSLSAMVAEQGYDPSALRRVPQSW